MTLQSSWSKGLQEQSKSFLGLWSCFGETAFIMFGQVTNCCCFSQLFPRAAAFRLSLALICLWKSCCKPRMETISGSRRRACSSMSTQLGHRNFLSRSLCDRLNWAKKSEDCLIISNHYVIGVFLRTDMPHQTVCADCFESLVDLRWSKFFSFNLWLFGFWVSYTRKTRNWMSTDNGLRNCFWLSQRFAIPKLEAKLP